MDERELVELIAQEVLKTLKETGSNQTQPKLLPLVILSGESEELSCEIINDLAKSGHEFRLFCDETSFKAEKLPKTLQARLVYGTTEAELAKVLHSVSLLYLPWLPLAALSRLVHLQPDCIVSLLITKALLKGISVRAQKIFTGPELNMYKLHEPSPVLRRVQGLISEGAQMGLKWTAYGEIEKSLTLPAPKEQRGGKRLLTAADVKSLKNFGTITVKKGTIITPLAKDEMKRYRLKLVFTD